jgi:hypothetical protein
MRVHMLTAHTSAPAPVSVVTDHPSRQMPLMCGQPAYLETISPVEAAVHASGECVAHHRLARPAGQLHGAGAAQSLVD